MVGQDGISYAPVREQTHMRAIREQIAGWNGNPSDEECAGGSLRGVGMFEWEDVKGYLDTLERNRTATNVAMLVPQVSWRSLPDGYIADSCVHRGIYDCLRVGRTTR